MRTDTLIIGLNLTAERHLRNNLSGVYGNARRDGHLHLGVISMARMLGTDPTPVTNPNPNGMITTTVGEAGRTRTTTTLDSGSRLSPGLLLLIGGSLNET